jgi:hypothetical protein
MVVAAGMIGSFMLLKVAEDKVGTAQKKKYKSYFLAEELRQSSDDLTRLGRAYVTTADEKYEQQYFDILEIRNGKSRGQLGIIAFTGISLRSVWKNRAPTSSPNRLKI